VSATQSMQDERREAIDGMRAFADWLEEHPDAEVPASYEVGCVHLVASAEELTSLARSLGGRWEKRVDDDAFRLCRMIGGFRYTLYASRGTVCTGRKVTVTKTVTERDPAVVEAALAAIPEVTREVEVEETVWDCPESLLAESPAEAA
jgi:hypothetical protein